MRDWFKARNIWGAAIFALSDAEAGRLMKALWTYTMTGEQQNLSGAERAIFAMILMTLGQDEQANADISQKRAAAGSMGGKQTQANASKEKQNEQMQANASNKNKNKEKEEDIKENNTKEKSRGFDVFWAAYPRHTGKQAAQKAFERINPDDDLLNIMLSSISAWKNSDQWTKDGGQFIPHPATWLNGRRWEDELPKIVPFKGKQVTAQMYTQREYTEEELDSVSANLIEEAKRIYGEGLT